ncbi:gentisate transporter [Tersicoccus solisilvae]|uniref:Gentisate transporter n=1 Tax=Tersicoccus solisilvae TaxID=1882339 RepID=A0ABQ1PFC2_9MICC|nr:aromatic acid/H+ symport family MFS transporter [Tersicoccus solisilvae]GGC96224.1 gentisate transporter [Tersicoccus solisilvae]
MSHTTPASTTVSHAPAPRTFGRRSLVAVIICWLLVVFDGYDLIVYGTVQNELIARTGWGLNAASAGTIGSLAFVGMMIGAVFAGRMSDTWGRKRTILGCAIVFSLFTVLCAFAPNAPVFGALRLLAGIGLGGLVPTANALAAELIPARWRSMMATLMMSGVPIGGSIAALSGLALIPTLGWPSMFLVAVLALVVLVPVGFAVLPETLASTGRGAADGAAEIEKPGFGHLLRPPYLGMSVLFAIATLFTLFAWYGLGTQLPKIMASTGFDLGPALTFTLALNLGAVAGSLLTAWAGDRFGAVPTGIVAAVLAGVSLVLLITHPSATGVVYLLLVLAGVGTHGTQCLIIAAIASRYPDRLRGTALGWALGVGRIGAVLAPQISGLLLATKGLDPAVNFIVFGVAALVAAALLLGVRRHPVAINENHALEVT